MPVNGVVAPVLGDDKTEYSSKIDTAFTNLKNHDHTSGKGDSIGSSAIATGAVTESKIGAGAVTEDKIGTGAVTETKIGDGAVTKAKQEAANVAYSADTTETHATDNSWSADFCSTAITPKVSGRPILLSLQPENSSSSANLYVSENNDSTGISNNSLIGIFRDGVQICEAYPAYILLQNTAATIDALSTGSGLGFTFIDLGASGTSEITYTIRLYASSTESVYIQNMRLVAVEL